MSDYDYASGIQVELSAARRRIATLEATNEALTLENRTVKESLTVAATDLIAAKNENLQALGVISDYFESHVDMSEVVGVCYSEHPSVFSKAVVTQLTTSKESNAALVARMGELERELEGSRNATMIVAEVANALDKSVQDGGSNAKRTS